MFEGVYRNMEPIADFGARRTLGVGGSVRGYIETGNAYDKHYYNKDTKPDSFEKADKKGKAGKIAGAIAAIAAAGAAIFVAVKKPEKIMNVLNGAREAIAKRCPEGVKNVFKNAGKNLTETANTVRKKFANLNIGEKFNNFKAKFAKETAEEATTAADKTNFIDKIKDFFGKFGKKATESAETVVEKAEDMRMYI